MLKACLLVFTDVQACVACIQCGALSQCSWVCPLCFALSRLTSHCLLFFLQRLGHLCLGAPRQCSPGHCHGAPEYRWPDTRRKKRRQHASLASHLKTPMLQGQVGPSQGCLYLPLRFGRGQERLSLLRLWLRGWSEQATSAEQCQASEPMLWDHPPYIVTSQK